MSKSIRLLSMNVTTNTHTHTHNIGKLIICERFHWERKENVTHQNEMVNEIDTQLDIGCCVVCLNSKEMGKKPDSKGDIQ